jgi:ATP-dependent exoDNAse (exonuclease V) beta subunit
LQPVTNFLTFVYYAKHLLRHQRICWFGKTYTLVQSVADDLSQISESIGCNQNSIALTFTNKAANEMKERILFYLGEFVKENYSENQDLKNIQKALSEQGYELH